MCGIFCVFKNNTDCARENDRNSFKDEKTPSLLLCRGPDLNDCKSYSFGNKTIFMFGATLWMQGTEPCSQPQENEYGALLFNGDDYSKDKQICDTEEIFIQLTNNTSAEEDINYINQIVGPFSLIYLNKRSKKVYFCRDKYGRKSLLISRWKDEIIISSVLSKSYSEVLELSSKSVYCLDILTFTVTEYPWNNILSHSSINLEHLFISFSSPIVDDYPEDSLASEMDLEMILFYKDIEIMASQLNCRKKFLQKLLTLDVFIKLVDKLIDLLSQSVKTRVSKQPPYCKICIKSRIKCEKHCRVAVLFSGGLDCTILAALAHKHVPSNEPIDLLNVAFEHKNCKNYHVPDRITSLQSLEELQHLYPTREWNLLEINVPKVELSEKQSETISDLVYPLQTILDESLGSALWFAARGRTQDYESTARVILMGMGADELFGGYMRHRNAFKRGGWRGLQRELDLDWRRLPTRNLARDDRVVSHHGRQPRTPYLDEYFLQYVLQLKPWERCFPSECCEAGVGDKLLLRLAAMKIGLENTSIIPKRAIQFGSRIANKNENAKDISSKLQ